MQFLPLFHNLNKRPCLVVGGGTVAARRVNLLRQAGAHVTVLAPEVVDSITTLEQTPVTPRVHQQESVEPISQASGSAMGQVRVILGTFNADDACDFDLVIAATNDRVVNAQVSAWARANGRPVNVVDDPALCSVIMPAIVNRDPVIVAISTSGTSPTLARLLRAQLESVLPRHLGQLAGSIARLRQRLKRVLPDISARTRIWGRVIADQLTRPFAGSTAQLEGELRQRLLTQVDRQSQRHKGSVSLVGAGPGDPDLLTLAALRALQCADVIVHDRLVPQSIIDMGRRDAEIISVGKTGYGTSTPQTAINALLLDLAARGKQVCRLKGGDPFVFGRGGEELEELQGAGVEVRVIPGISSAVACAAAAGIPLTHRDYAQGVALLTGHSATSPDPAQFNPEQNLPITRVYYMAVRKLADIEHQLIQAGHAPELPIAIVERGGLPGQQVIAGQLGGLAALAKSCKVQSPALLIVGKVARFARADIRQGDAYDEAPRSSAQPMAGSAADLRCA